MAKKELEVVEEVEEVEETIVTDEEVEKEATETDADEE